MARAASEGWDEPTEGDNGYAVAPGYEPEPELTHALDGPRRKATGDTR